MGAEELTLLDATIRNRGKLFLNGPRRFGKTSLLSAAAQDAGAMGIVVLRFDAEKFETLEVLALHRGWHPLEVLFFQSAGGKDLLLEVEGPGFTRREVPATWLGRAAMEQRGLPIR